MIRRMGSLALLLTLLSACGERQRPVAAAADSAPPVPPTRDSLVLTTKQGAEIWFVAERPATDSAGSPCIERAMEIRWSGKATPIPLLYTGAAPRLVNDTTIEAAIWLHCKPGNVYRVDLHTGRPVRVK